MAMRDEAGGFWCGQPAEALFSWRQAAAFKILSRGPSVDDDRPSHFSVNGGFWREADVRRNEEVG
jgi:hypothetical protein